MPPWKSEMSKAPLSQFSVSFECSLVLAMVCVSSTLSHVLSFCLSSFQNSLELLLHPATSHSLWSWQHGRVLEAFMCQGQHAIALRYLHVMKPSLSTTREAKLCLSVLLHNRYELRMHTCHIWCHRASRSLVLSQNSKMG